MRFLFLIIAMLSGIGLKAQDINSLFIAMPDSLSPLLTKVNRQDFADFLASGMKAVVKNKFGGESEMLKLTDDYLKLRTSTSSVEEMKLLPVNDSVNVVCVVKTYCGPVEDSSIEFYTTDWKRLPAGDYITLPSICDFFHDGSLPKFDDMFLYKAVLSDGNNDIGFVFRSLDVTDKETSEKLSGYARKEIIYSWTNGRYEMER